MNRIYANLKYDQLFHTFGNKAYIEKILLTFQKKVENSNQSSNNEDQKKTP
jgi:hypothetical protein